MRRCVDLGDEVFESGCLGVEDTVGGAGATRFLRGVVAVLPARFSADAFVRETGISGALDFLRRLMVAVEGPLSIDEASERVDPPNWLDISDVSIELIESLWLCCFRGVGTGVRRGDGLTITGTIAFSGSSSPSSSKGFAGTAVLSFGGGGLGGFTDTGKEDSSSSSLPNGFVLTLRAEGTGLVMFAGCSSSESSPNGFKSVGYNSFAFVEASSLTLSSSGVVTTVVGTTTGISASTSVSLIGTSSLILIVGGSSKLSTTLGTSSTGMSAVVSSNASDGLSSSGCSGFTFSTKSITFETSSSTTLRASCSSCAVLLTSTVLLVLEFRRLSTISF